MPIVTDATETGPRKTARLSRGVAWATVVLGVLALASAITTPPRSGPLCGSGCIGYPYTDAAAFVPRDYWWMYPQSALVLASLMLLICVHQAAASAVRVFSGIAVAFAAVAVPALLVDYAIQLAVLQPSFLRGETGGLALFSQYNPHGVFVAMENVGYLLLGLALFTAAAVFTAPTRLERTLRWVLMAGGALSVVALPTLAILNGADLEYRYEVTAMALTWLTLITGGILLTRWFRPSVAALAPAADSAAGHGRRQRAH